jgi:hypothetical protein
MALHRRFQLALATLLAGGSCALAVIAYRDAVRVSFNRDIAPIGFAHCAPCHRSGQPGPFSLLTYEDYREHARDIADVVEDRYMPPWKPSDRSGTFLGQRALDDADIALIRRWVDEGMVEGDDEDRPPLPAWPKGYVLGEPDAVLRLAAPYVLGPSGRDEYRNFVIPSPVKRPVWVVGWELHPRGRAIHHAILKIDRMGNARRADARDPAPGFGEMEAEGVQSPDGFYLVWAPGKTPVRAVDGSAWRLDANTDLVLQLHMQRTGKEELVDPEFALFFSDAPPTQRRLSLRIGDPPIDIAPGEADYRITDQLTLAADIELLGMFPHAHCLGKTVRVASRLPDGRELELLRIDDWDFNWQDEYTFARPPLLPKGSTLQMEIHYDNSEHNPRNPNRPPLRVRSGQQSTDEMGNVTFQVKPVRIEDADVLLEAKYRGQLDRSPNAEGHYNLANALARQSKTAEARKHYELAIRRDPSLSSARYNFALLLNGMGEHEAAAEQLRETVAERPEDSGLQLALAHVLAGAHKLDDARAHCLRALEIDPSNAAAKILLEALQSGAVPATR